MASFVLLSRRGGCQRRHAFSSLLWRCTLILFLRGVSSFLVGRRRLILTPSRTNQIVCNLEQEEIRCWELRRLTTQSTTLLYEKTELEIESPSIKINGDSNGFIIKGASAANGASKNGASLVDRESHQHLNGHFNGVAIERTSSPDIVELDVPQLTVNGGYTHTRASREKIALANKGKTPWNKGRQRSDEEKARIAAGVRARNRERFLQKLKDMGVTEEEHEAKNKEERRKKDAERRARRTENGGYRPTEETKAKISKILKEKHARGEITRRSADPSKVRRGFTHSEETKQKISDSLRKRWSGDQKYRDRMSTSMKKTYSKEEVRKKVSETLKAKWKDPQFREEMLAKMRKNRSSPQVTEEYREKISRAMKRKWQDADYRQKTLTAIAEHNKSLGRKSNARKASKPKGSATKDAVTMAQPLAPGEPTPKTKRAVAQNRAVTVRKVPSSTPKAATKVKAPGTSTVKKKKKKKKVATKKEPDGSVNRLREERRDLFDLLYGDEDFEDEDDGSDPSDGIINSPLTDRLRSRFDFGDEDLDAFDPYGLDNY